MRCCIVRDLLSNYMEGLCCEETNEEVRGHLEGCRECRAVYEGRSSAVPQGMASEGQDIGFLKKLKRRMQRHKAVAAALACAMMLACTLVFAGNHYLTLPFDPEHMWVAPYKAAVITEESGTISWLNVDRLRDILPEDSDQVMDALQLVYRGIDNISVDVVGRTIGRDGGNVKVFYYRYQESLWDSWFADPDLKTGGCYLPVYGDGYRSGDYKPQMTEIYYLPVKHLDKLNHMTDEEFDRLREKGELIWSGIV